MFTQLYRTILLIVTLRQVFGTPTKSPVTGLQSLRWLGPESPDNTKTIGSALDTPKESIEAEATEHPSSPVSCPSTFSTEVEQISAQDKEEQNLSWKYFESQECPCCNNKWENPGAIRSDEHGLPICSRCAPSKTQQYWWNIDFSSLIQNKKAPYPIRTS
ncbi:hypothetical protein PGT21_027566 [Puccinia graminis f. sp. tritici]|uniref:GATA-type domain-containing protein n=1 Tax=Puccinia graminis f. sp. tritici TaxID=56615 RepID=A0A5B0R678_PUCGR|nr:hypothetical protein PGT21_027566 [Puccinia graminis f. sp. tritici]KAA1120878.1 hypothetical protein PGTUg99_006335 [Puccinia graminis f. sp. tritici]